MTMEGFMMIRFMRISRSIHSLSSAEPGTVT